MTTGQIAIPRFISRLLFLGISAVYCQLFAEDGPAPRHDCLRDWRVLCVGLHTARSTAANLEEARSHLHPLVTHSSCCACLSGRSLRRQIRKRIASKVRTVCSSSCKYGLCGGWLVTAIPTATASFCYRTASVSDRQSGLGSQLLHRIRVSTREAARTEIEIARGCSQV